MAIDFDALDLVRTKNKAKMYEQKKREQLLKRVDDIKQKLLNVSLVRSFLSFSFSPLANAIIILS